MGKLATFRELKKAMGRIFFETAHKYTETSSCGCGDAGIDNFGLLPHTLLSTTSLLLSLSFHLSDLYKIYCAIH